VDVREATMEDAAEVLAFVRAKAEFDRGLGERKRHRAARRKGAASTPYLELLEDRCLLSFSPAVSYPVGLTPRDVQMADFNGDGKLDLAVVDFDGGTSTVNVLLGKPVGLGNADGTFQPALTFATGTGPQSLAVGDFNKDGKLDLATANAGDVSVLLGNGDGTFQAPTSISLGDAGARRPWPWATSTATVRSTSG